MDIQQNRVYTSAGDMQTAAFNPTEPPSYSSLGVIEDMLNTPAQLDWRLYDSHIFGLEAADEDNIWLPAATTAPELDFDVYTPGL